MFSSEVNYIDKSKGISYTIIEITTFNNNDLILFLIKLLVIVENAAIIVALTYLIVL